MEENNQISKLCTVAWCSNTRGKWLFLFVITIIVIIIIILYSLLFRFFPSFSSFVLSYNCREINFQKRHKFPILWSMSHEVWKGAQWHYSYSYIISTKSLITSQLLSIILLSTAKFLSLPFNNFVRVECPGSYSVDNSINGMTFLRLSWLWTLI